MDGFHRRLLTLEIAFLSWLTGVIIGSGLRFFL